MDYHYNKRNGIINSINMISVLASEIVNAPKIISFDNTNIFTNEAVLRVKISYTGGLICGIFKNDFAPNSLDEVRIQNNIFYSIKNEIDLTVIFRNLDASTDYNIYCFTFSSNGATMPFVDMMKYGRHIIRTKCCKTITTSISSWYISNNDNNLDLISLSIDAIPSKFINVQLYLTAVGSSIQNNLLVPSNILFTNSLNQYFSQYVSFESKGIAIGSYSVSVIVTGPSSNEYISTFSSDNSLIYVSSSIVHQPQLISAEFSSYGESIILTFESPTNQALMKSEQLFFCDSILDFPNSRLSTCKWTDNLHLVVYPFFNTSAIIGAYKGTSEYNKADVSFLEVGDYIYLKNCVVEMRG
jgi:hypothetical protein